MKYAIASRFDRIDQIVFANYGTLEVMNEVMMANQHLLTKPVLDEGDRVCLPDIDIPDPQEKGVSLW